VDTINTRLVEITTHAKRRRLLPRKKKVDLAIDCTDLPYYGDPNDQGVVGGKPKKSTKWFFRFATVCIVEKGYRFPLGVIPVDQLRTSDLPGVVTELLEMASRHVSVRTLLMDRGFHSVKLFKKLRELGVRWLMPARNSKRVKEGIKELEESARQGGPKSKRISLKGQGGEVQVTLMVEWNKKKSKWLGYLSDRWRNVKRYRKRWGIETQYRVVNQSRGWTTSKSWVVRVMLYGFGVLVNGVWELYRRLLTRGSREVLDRGRRRKTDRSFKTWAEKKSQVKVFIAILLEFLPHGGEIM
jgi:putative transposase